MDLNDDIFFAPLIHEEDYGYNAYTPTSIHENIDSQNTQLQPQTEFTTKKSSRKGNFGVEEDNILVSAWLITSMDAIHGIDQKASKFWMRVHAEYDEHKKPTFCERSVNSLTNRWSTIQLATNKFCGCIAQIEARHPSGVTEQDKIEEAKVMYHSIHGGSFNFEHCWNTLRFHPKWKRTMSEGVKKKKRKSLVQEPSCTLYSVHLGDDNGSPSVVVNLERPIGNKAQKEREKTRKRQDHMSANLVEVVNDIKEEKNKSRDQRIEDRQEYIRLTKERLVFEQSREEMEKEANLLCKKRLEMEQSREEMEKEANIISKKRLEMEQSREVREQEANLLRKKKLEMEQLREDREIMSMDTSNMSPMRKAYFRSRQMEVIEKRMVIPT